MSFRIPAFVLAISVAILSPAGAQPPPHRAMGAPPPPSALRLGLQLGLLFPDDRGGIGIDGGGAERIDAYLRSVPGRAEEIAERLGGAFVIDGEPADFASNPVLTFGFRAAYEFRPGWTGGVSLSSYRAEVAARLPLLVETESGPAAAAGRVVADVRGILADAFVRRQWSAGRYLPGLGCGIRFHRTAPDDPRVEIEQVGFFVDEADARNEFSPFLEIGIGRSLTEKIQIGLSCLLAGRSLPDEGGGSGWVLEPEIRLSGIFRLDSKEPGPPPSFDSPPGETPPPENAPPPGTPPPEDAPPPEEPPDAPPPEKEQHCALTHEIEAFPPISAELLHPDTTEGYPRLPFTYIPLVVRADDTDRIRQRCTCSEDGSTSERFVDITDRILYTWTQESGEGSLIWNGGPAALYMLPELEIAAFDTASFVCRIADGRGNDDPVFCRVRTFIRRTSACIYSHSAAIVDSFPAYSFLQSAPRAGGSCIPAAPSWDPDPDFMVFESVPDEICVGQHRIFTAESPDGDQDLLRLSCAGDCGEDDRETPLPDEHTYIWTAVRGAFAGRDGRYWESVTTNGRKSSVDYLAPEEAGGDTITIEFRDSGKQGPDAPKIRRKAIRVVEVDLDVVDDGIYYAGVADEYETCDGATVAWNTDDDNENGKGDLSERTVKDEDDLLEVRLEVRGTKSGTVSFDLFQPGKGRVRAWESAAKRKEIKLPRTYPVSSLPKTVWVEGTAVSGWMRDVTMTLRRSEGCYDEAAVTVVPWCADAGEDCDWMIHTRSYGEEDRDWSEVGKHLADGQSALIADCDARDPASFGACMRKFFDEHPDCCCIMELVIIGHGPDCSDDEALNGDRAQPAPSGLGGGAETWTDDAYKLWEQMLCDEATIEYRKCNGYYESFFWEFAARLGAGREVEAYTETVTPLTPGLSDSKKFEVPKDARPGDGEELKKLADCITDPARDEAEKEACRAEWAERGRR